jgi:hypothetical protein
MQKLYRTFLAFVGLLSTVCMAQAQANLTASYKLLRDTAGDHLIISGRTDFPTESITFTGQATTTSGNTVTLTIPPAALVPTFGSGPVATGATYTRVIDYGIGKPLTPDMDFLNVKITAQPFVTTTNPNPTAVTAGMRLDMTFVKEHFSILNELARTQTPPSPTLPVPSLSVAGATILDRTILLRVNSNQAAKVRAEATIRGTTNVVSTSNEVEIPSGGQATLRIGNPNLNPGTNYDITVRETNPLGGRPPAQLLVNTNPSTGAPLQTLPQIPTPAVSFVPNAPLKIVNNRQIKIPMTGQNAPRVRLTLEAQDINGVWTAVEPPSITTISSNIGETPSALLRLQQNALNPQVSYRVKVEGLTQFDDADPGSSILSTTFNGLSPLLAQAVDLEFTADGIRFTANTNNTPAKLEVKVGSGAQSFSYSTSTTGGNPSFVLPFSTLQSAVSAAPNTDPRLPLAIGVRADDGSDREQNLAIALKINRAELTTKPSGAKERITGFVQDLRSGTQFAPNSGKSIKVGDILRTGLSLLLRFLVPIP